MTLLPRWLQRSDHVTTRPERTGSKRSPARAIDEPPETGTIVSLASIRLVRLRSAVRLFERAGVHRTGGIVRAARMAALADELDKLEKTASSLQWGTRASTVTANTLRQLLRRIEISEDEVRDLDRTVPEAGLVATLMAHDTRQLVLLHYVHLIGDLDATEEHKSHVEMGCFALCSNRSTPTWLLRPWAEMGPLLERTLPHRASVEVTSLAEAMRLRAHRRAEIEACDDASRHAIYSEELRLLREEANDDRLDPRVIYHLAALHIERRNAWAAAQRIAVGAAA